MNNSFTIVTAILGSGILSTIISHLLYNQKLKKEQLMKNENGIGRKMREALEKAHEIIQKMNVIEIYGIEQTIHDPNFRTIEGNIIYPEILNNSKELRKFQDEVRNYREKYERYIDCITALYIVLIDRYIKQLGIFLGQYKQKHWPTWGVIFMVDIQMISKKCEKRLIKRINKQKYKMEYQNGMKWRILREKILVKNWEKTMLCKLIDNKHLEEFEKEAINYVLSEIEKDEQKKQA